MGKIRVCAIAEFPEAGSLMVQGSEKTLAVFKLEDRFYATEELCPHRGGPLSEGQREGECVTCPWHQAKFHIPDGKKLGGPVQRDLTVYPVVRDGDELWVVES